MSNNAPTRLRVGVARRDITPPLGTPLMGYARPERTALTVRDPLYATALAFERGGVAAALVSLDIAIIADDLVALIRSEVQKRTKGAIPGDHVNVCATQTHSGPNVQDCWGWCDRNQPFLDRMIPAAIDAIVEAYEKRGPALVGVGMVSSDVGVNRREVREDHSIALGNNPWGAYDPAMIVARFEDPARLAKGEPATIATLINYGAHPTVFDGATRAISRDWPGVMIDRVEHFSKAPALFINGAVGDIAPRTNLCHAIGDGEAALQEVGTRAAMDAMRAWRDIREYRDVPLHVEVGDFTMTFRPLADLKTAKQKAREFAPKREEYGYHRCEALHWQSVVDMHALQNKIRAAVKKSGKKAAKDFTLPGVNRNVKPVVNEQGDVIGKNFRQNVTVLGHIAIISFPGEPFGETILRIRQKCPFAYMMPASTSNGCDGYFPSRESLHRGGYEVWVAKAFGPYILAENIDDVLFTENLRLLRTAHAKVHTPVVTAKSAKKIS